MAIESPIPGLLAKLPGLLVVTDHAGAIQWIGGEAVETVGVAVGPLDYIGTLFSRPAAIFLETHLWPSLRRHGRIDECYAPLQQADGSAWPCLVSARRLDDEGRLVWLCFEARDRAGFESSLIEARTAAQRLAGELAEANQRLHQQALALDERNRELGELALTDPLTGLGNRRALERAFHATGPDGRQGALMMVDADHFKAVNDRWGHAMGDSVLVQLGATLRSCSRRSDVVVRLGGEEFALWLPEADADVAARVAEAVHARIADAKLAGGDGALTVSIGIAIGQGGPEPGAFTQLMQRADAALYAAKAAGRHRTCWAPVTTG